MSYVTGRTIKELREKRKITQKELSEKIGVSDKTVSKWETGKSMPDSSIMLELCEILGITVNELLSGEVITMENYEKTADENLIALKRKDELLMKYNKVIVRDNETRKEKIYIISRNPE